MYHRLLLVTVTILLLIPGCKTAKLPAGKTLPTASISEEGFLDCFTPGTSLNGQTVWCEASAVVFDGKNVLIANDKDMPDGLSPVFMKTPATLGDSTQPPLYLTQPIFSAARKYEDFAQTPDQRFVFLTTAFDRVKPGSHDWDGYNTILYWRTGDEQHPHVLAPDDTSRTSMGYRQQLARVLATNEFPGEMPYFKVEGLAATDRQLLFGIREEGKDYKDFMYRAQLVSVSYRIDKTGDGERIRLENDWKVINDFVIAKADSTLPQMGLSSLEYDPARQLVWMLTSQEIDNRLDTFIWAAPLSDVYAGKPFALIRDSQGKPLHTAGHKAEDITILPNNQLLLIADDDRVPTTIGTHTRQPNQAAYFILTLH
ncbi:hypothetical protein [Spirosoma spitsbergense]|uniref:hypothetical protein n=1 Tax=Spirosoma spitsbergense TaxID=431554 RepID=UPI0003725571|nr:hypothetical protein [Spirosoma spitsbergense]